LAIVLLLAASQGLAQRKKEKLVAFDMTNVADIEDNLVDIDMSQYKVFAEEHANDTPEEWGLDIPPDDDISDYDVLDDDGHGVDPTEVIEPSRKKRRIRKK